MCIASRKVRVRFLDRPLPELLTQGTSRRRGAGKHHHARRRSVEAMNEAEKWISLALLLEPFFAKGEHVGVSRAVRLRKPP